MSEESEPDPPKIHKVVLTGGPCGGKTTAQAHLRNFFENFGWKVFLVPEAASIFISGGIKFHEMTYAQKVIFQEKLLLATVEIEAMFHRFAEESSQDVLVVFDRGIMDISSYIEKADWQDILARNNLNEGDFINNRYNQVIHLVSAAIGAESFYNITGHPSRAEDIQAATECDQRCSLAWMGHPCFEIVDNSTDFKAKMDRLISKVCVQLALNVSDRFDTASRKVKFIVKMPLAPFPDNVEYRDFTVVYDYLSTSDENVRARLRKRGFNDQWNYTHAIRHAVDGQPVELKTMLSSREYTLMLTQRDTNHFKVHITRRYFIINDLYFQMDIYEKPCHSRCESLILLETYTAMSSESIRGKLPSFLEITEEVTGNPCYSMFNLSLNGEWENNTLFSYLASSRSSDFTVAAPDNQ